MTPHPPTLKYYVICEPSLTVGVAVVTKHQLRSPETARATDAGAVVTAKHDRRAEARADLEARGKLPLDWDDDFPIGDDASVGDKHQAPEKVRDVAHLAWVVLQIVVGIQKAHTPL